jgi:4-diphosphocytidyl-2-C-methyl-D-erythritol kinase
MPVTVRSFAKINLGLRIGRRRADGFHELATVYQTISLHDTIRVEAEPGRGIEIRCADERVPADETNTCWRVAERVLRALARPARVTIGIEKRLPVQGGMGAASANAVATMFALERALGAALTPEQRWRIAAEVGSDLNLFLVGGTVLGIGRGEQVYPLPDLPALPLVVAMPAVGVSTPVAFADWDREFASADEAEAGEGLTKDGASARIEGFSQSVYRWLTAGLPLAAAGTTAGAPARGGSQAEIPGSSGGGQVASGETSTALLDLVRAGIENDFERVVFPKYPAVREVRQALERAGARYASLSGSGSTVYGVFATAEAAVVAAARLRESGTAALATSTLGRRRYWTELFEG